MTSPCAEPLCLACGSPLQRGDFRLCKPCGAELIGAVSAHAVVEEAFADLDAEDDARAEDERLYGGPQA